MIDSADIFKAFLFARRGSLTTVTSTTVISDSNLSSVFLVPSFLIGKKIILKTGPAAGQSRTIVSVALPNLTVSVPFDNLPTIGNNYEINTGPTPSPVPSGVAVGNAVNDRISPLTAFDTRGIETDPTALSAPGGVNPIVFTFGIAGFILALAALGIAPTQAAGITSLSLAFSTGLSTSLIVPFNGTGTGVFIPPGLPPLQVFSSITTIILEPTSVLAAQNKILEFIGFAPDSDQLPVKMREAFLLLKINVVGLDSSAPTPAPLTALNVPLI